MARIPAEEIERLKREVSLERLVTGAGVELRPHGKDLLGLCPFHDDHEPSLVITPGKNLWHCLGACGTGGSVIDWVMRMEKVSFRRAVEILRDKAGYAPLPVAGSTEAALPLDVDDEELKRRVVSFYHETLKTSPEALTYLAKRGLLAGGDKMAGGSRLAAGGKDNDDPSSFHQPRTSSHELLETFQPGYANRTLAYRLPEKNRAAGAEIRGRLQHLGLLRESGHEHFNGSLVIPVFDGDGRVTEIYGRKIRDDLRKGTPLHLYLPRIAGGTCLAVDGDGKGNLRPASFQESRAASCEPARHEPASGRGVWNIQALQTSAEIILCESLIDALTFWVHGFRNVTAAYGVNGFTEDHRTAFKRYGTERVYIAYDRDEAGGQAAAALAGQLITEGLECFRVLFPKGMDANEYALRMNPPGKALDLVLRHAEWMGKGCKSDGRRVTGLTDGRRVTGHGSKGEERLAVDGSDRSLKNGISVLAAGAEPEAATENPAARSLAAEIPAAATKEEAAGPDAASFLAAPAGELPVHPAPLLLPPGPGLDLPVRINGDEIIILREDRRWRVRGLSKNLSYEMLKVNVLVSRPASSHPSPATRLPSEKDSWLPSAESAFHVDTFDLYQARHRATFIKQASIELGLKEETVKQDLGKVLLKLEGLQDEQIRKALEPQEKTVDLTAEERAEALELLRSPDLLERILQDFEACGVVGEETNKLVGYLAAVSRKLEKPLAVMIQSSSAAGKSALMEAVLAFMPEEEKVKYSAMTGQSLFYMGETDLRHKILAIAEEAGAERAAYALKMLQSEGELSIASTGKDPATGRLVTHEYKVQGPVMVFLTTTSIEIDEELQNRCVVLSVDENREQTKAIHKLQREQRTLDGHRRKAGRARLLTLHRNAQRLLRPLPVVNPYAGRLTFLDDKTRTRRDHGKYLDLIDAITLLHQYQRPVKRTAGASGFEYIEASLADIAAANRLAGEILGRSLDELPPQTRRFLELLEHMVNRRCAERKASRDEIRFSRRDVREATGWTYFQVRVHLDRLVELEYVLAHRGGRGQSFEYELLYDGQGKDGKPFLAGLIDAESLRGPVPADGTAESLRGAAAGLRGDHPPFEVPLSPRSAPVEPRLRGGFIAPDAAPVLAPDDSVTAKAEKTHTGGNGKKPPPYPQARHTPALSLAAAAAPLAAAGEGVRR